MVTLSAGLSEADLCMVKHPSAASALEFPLSSDTPQVHYVSSTRSGLSWSTLMLDFVEEEAQGSELSL